MSSGVSWVDMVKNPVDRRRTLLAIGAVSLQASSGAMFIIGKAWTFADHQAAHTNPFTAYKAYFLTMAKVSNPFAMYINFQGPQADSD